MKPLRSEATKRIKKIKNKILAIPAEAAAIPPNPNTAAIKATTRKMSVQRNMGHLHIPNSMFDCLRFPGCVNGGLSSWI